MRIMPKEEYWLNKLNIHLDQIEKQLSLEKEQAIEKLATKLDKRICGLLAEEMGLTNNVFEDQVDFAKMLIENYPKEFRQFIYLTEFVGYKRKEAIISIAEEKLHPDLLKTLDLDYRKPNPKDVLWLICELFCQDPEILFDVYLKDIEKKHATGTWFQTLFDGKSVNPKALTKMLEPQSIKNALAKLDVPNAISCPKVVDGDHEKVLFLNAEITAKILKLRDSRNQGYTDDWIIVRFDKQKNRVRIATKSLDKGADIVCGLIKTVSQAECSLREEDEKTPARTIKKFTKTLLKDKKHADAMLEIELDNAPIEGVGTRIRVKNDFSIGKPLLALSERYGWFEKVDYMNRLLYIKVRHNEKDFKLQFEWIDESPLASFVRWDDSHVDSDLQEEFKQYMREKYEINICCKRRRFNSSSAD